MIYNDSIVPSSKWVILWGSIDCPHLWMLWQDAQQLTLPDHCQSSIYHHNFPWSCWEHAFPWWCQSLCALPVHSTFSILLAQSIHPYAAPCKSLWNCLLQVSLLFQSLLFSGSFCSLQLSGQGFRMFQWPFLFWR